MSGLLRAILTDPVKDELFEDLQNSCNNQYTPLSEDAKLKIWVQGNAKGFEFCALSEKVQLYSLPAIFGAR